MSFNESMNDDFKRMLAESKAWFDDRKQANALKDFEQHVATKRKMQSDHDSWIANQKAASEKRISDYRESSMARFEELRAEAFPEETEAYEPDEEPETDEEFMVDELVNRMEANE